ncbi:DUF2125 domain-containing protein [Defluviimonas sp. SAOS-178_SWC]|uniref:DUF2125 domain-containing protein n=1 Tax=Defluviimonas sp. SAOS-178_SWC TaxID=3121287 RepID=UPI0032219AD6
MRIVLWLVAAFAAIYGGYWVVGSRALMAGAEATLAEMRAAGLADYGTISLAGFPSRFDVTLTEPELTSVDGAVAWSAPELHVHALSYKPHHVIATLPAQQTLRLGRETVAVTSEELNASAVFGLDPSLPLDHAQAVGRRLDLRSDFGWGFAAEEARAAIREGSDPLTQEVGVELTGLTLSGLPADLITTGGALPDRGERAYLDARIELDRPLDRFAATEPMRIRAADIRSLALEWGPVRLAGRGVLTISAGGEPEGRLDLSVENWRAALKLVTALGLVRTETAPTVERALESLALLSGNAERLSMPLVFRGGRMSLGPVPLGPAPRY